MIYYGGSVSPIHVEDHALAHLKVVIITKLRRNESFTVSWPHREGESPGRSSIWLHPAVPLRFVFGDPVGPELDREYLTRLANSANSSSGIHLTSEDMGLCLCASQQGAMTDPHAPVLARKP